LQKVLLDILIVKVFCGTDLNSKVATGKYFAWNYRRNPNRVFSNFVYSMSFRWSFLLWKAFDRFEEEVDRAGDHKQSWKEHLMSSYIWDWSYSMNVNKKHWIRSSAWFCLAKGQKYIEQLRQIQVTAIDISFTITLHRNT